MTRLANVLKTLVAKAEMKIVGIRGPLAELYQNTANVEYEALDRDTCRRLCSIIDAEIESGSHKRLWVDNEKSDYRILGFEKLIDEGCKKALNIDEKIVQIEKYLGKKVGSWCLMANRLTPAESGKGSGGGVHRDSAYRHQIKFIWYLSDVNPENGPFAYSPGTNKKIIRDKRTPVGETRAENVVLEEIVTGPAGTILVCDTKCLHGGLPIKTGTRYALTLYTYSQKNGVKRLYEKSGLEYSKAD